MSSLFELRLYIKRTPSLYALAKKYFGKGGTVCTSESQICIEGYPSSANSYTYHLFRHLLGNIHMGHHCHSFANVQIALNNNIPAIVLIRDPKGAITSNLARFDFNTDHAVKEYIEFYTLAHKNLNDIFLVSFEEIIQNTTRVLETIDEKIEELTFQDYSDIEETNTKVRNRMYDAQNRLGKDLDNISLPNEEREKRKKKILEEVINSAFYPEAEALYQTLKLKTLLTK